MSLKVGDVVAIYSSRFWETKYKYCILVAPSRTNNNWITVVINSDPAIDANVKPFFLDFPKTTNRKYLDDNSFVDCYSHVEFTEQEIQDSITKNAKNLLGHEDDDTMDEIKGLLRDNDRISEKTKKGYGYFRTY